LIPEIPYKLDCIVESIADAAAKAAVFDRVWLRARATADSEKKDESKIKRAKK
jgi:hypothetical protein